MRILVYFSFYLGEKIVEGIDMMLRTRLLSGQVTRLLSGQGAVLAVGFDVVLGSRGMMGLKLCSGG